MSDDADNNETVVAAVVAESENAAKEKILRAYDEGPERPEHIGAMRWRIVEGLPTHGAAHGGEPWWIDSDCEAECGDWIVLYPSGAIELVDDEHYTGPRS